jgi:hypothetical protein
MDQSAVYLTPPLRLLLAAMLLAPQAAAAQCLLCTAKQEPPDTIVVREAADAPLSVSITADLDFSRLVARSGGGTVTLDPRSGVSVARGGVAALGGYGFSGRVSVTGGAGRTVRISLPHEVVLTSTTGRTALVRDLVTDLPPLARLGPDGRLDFAFGGRLEVGGDADGSYNGRVAITVAYE